MDRDTARRRQRRADLDALKMSRGGCVDCGYNEHPAALQWDHIQPKEHGARTAFRSNWAWERILAEIAKCELVCACCHAIRTAQRGYGGGAPMHGIKRPAIVRGAFPRQRANTCKRGHPLSEGPCRICRRQRERDQRAADRARHLAAQQARAAARSA